MKSTFPVACKRYPSWALSTAVVLLLLFAEPVLLNDFTISGMVYALTRSGSICSASPLVAVRSFVNSGVTFTFLFGILNVTVFSSEYQWSSPMVERVVLLSVSVMVMRLSR